MGGSTLGGLVFFFWYYGSPEYTDVGYQPEQPINYSHKFHVGELGLDCRYCHSFVEVSPEANVPPTSTCWNCHEHIDKNSSDLALLKEKHDNKESIEWVKVHMLPDFAYFDHSVHLNANIGCVSCHGRVDQMDKVEQIEPLSMAWCLDCHRSPEEHIRPKGVSITDMNWNKPLDLDELNNHDSFIREFINNNNIVPPMDCSACHR